MKTPRKQTELDELFETYARAAPLGDLRAYLRYAERRVAEYELGAETMGRIGEMFALERDLIGRAGTPADKRRVWALIDRFKSSIPGSAGRAGSNDGVAPDALVRTWDILKTRPFNEEENLPLLTVLERYAAEHDAAVEKADASWRFDVPLRAVPLDAEQVAALIDAVTPVATEVAKPPKSVSWRARALAAEAKIAELERALVSATVPKPRVAPTNKRSVFVEFDGVKICRTCQTAQPIAHFAWAAGGSIRSICRECRKAQSRAARVAA